MNIKEFKEKLSQYFIHNAEKEWVDVNVVNVNTLEIRMVSEKAENIDVVRRYIAENLEALNAGISNQGEKFSLGYTNYATIEEAELFDIQKPIRREEKPSNFAELVEKQMNHDFDHTIAKKTKHKSRVISFYSYKGGVGRTVALIETAFLLAKEGKRVLLFDLDIEAPSFINIFKKQIGKPWGIVDYLYEAMYSNERKIRLSSIISKLNLNVEGEIYVIPAGKIDKNYVNKLDKLKEKRIFENEYIHELIREAEKGFAIDYVLVDSRTGINNWGALSLIDIADEVMLFGYPNRENVDGLKLIVDLIKENKKITVVFSRIDASLRGQEVANALFKELGLQQDYIAISYHSDIAIAEEYPIQDDKILQVYKVISDFILEEEINELNKKFIKKQSALAKEILNDFTKIESYEGFTQHEFKIQQDSNWIIVGKQEVYEDRIVKVLAEDIQYIDIESNIDFKEHNELDEDVLVEDGWEVLDLNKLVCTNQEYVQPLKHVCDMLNEKEHQNEDLEVYWSAYILYILNQPKKPDIYGIQELENKNFEEYISYILNHSSIYDELLLKICNMHHTGETGQQTNFQRSTYLIMYWNVIQEAFKDLEKHVLEEVLESLLKIVSNVNAGIADIDVKIHMTEQQYDEYRETLENYSFNMIDLNWSRMDYKAVKTEMIDIFDSFFFGVGLYGKLNDYLEFLESFKERGSKNSNMDLDFLKYFMSEEVILKLFNFMLGKRINKDIYSKEVLQWIYGELKQKDQLNPVALFRFLGKAAQIEKAAFEQKKEFDRIISMESLRKALLI